MNNSKPLSKTITRINLDEIGKNIIVAACSECGNDSFNIKWEQIGQQSIRLHALHCTECHCDIKMNDLSMSIVPPH